MASSTQKIYSGSSDCGGDLKKVLAAVNASTASVLDITASNMSLPEKALALKLRAGSATRQDISASHVGHQMKQVAYDIAGV